MQAKIAKVTEALKAHFGNQTLRTNGPEIKFNVNALADVHIITLGVLSIEWGCDVNVKRSGAGLLVIIKL